MPGFHFATEILVEHRREKEMVFVADECHVCGDPHSSRAVKIPPNPPPRITILGFVICGDLTTLAYLKK